MPKALTNSAILIVIIAIGIILWWSGLNSFIRQIPKSTPSHVEKADAIIILTGGKRRIQTGLRLLKQNYAPVLFISGVKPGIRKQNLTRGYPELRERIKLGLEADTTRQNASEIAAWVHKNHVRSCIILTNDYHMPRSKLELSRFLQSCKKTYYPVFTPWLHKHLKKNRVPSIVFSEYHKYLLANIRQPLERLFR